MPAPGVTGADQSLYLVRVPADLPPGAYRIGLSLPDPDLGRDPRYAIRLVGGALWDEAGGMNELNAQVSVGE
jgi:hypothetical protein